MPERTIAAYMRLSVREKSEGTSLEGQSTKIEGFAMTLDEDVDLAWYVDDGYSGTDPSRPAYDRMLEAVRRGEHSHIVARSVDRLGRNLRAFTDLVALADEHQTAVVAIGDDLNSHSETGRLMLNLLAVFAEHESRAIGQRGRYSHEVRRGEGRWTAGIPPFGLTTVKRDGGSYAVINPETVDALRHIVEMCINGESFLAISRWMNDEGYRTVRGGRWTPDTVAHTLRNPAIAGLRVTHADPSKPYENRSQRRKRGKPRGEGRLFTNDDGVPIVFEDHAAIDLQTWQRLKEATDKRRQAAFGRNDSADRPPQLLQGIAKCGTCGGPLSRNSSSVRRNGVNEQYETYRCSRSGHNGCERPVSVSAHLLNDLVLNDLRDQAEDEFYEVVTAEDSESAERKQLMQSEINRLATELAEADEASIAELSQKIARLRREIAATPTQTTTVYQPSGVTIGTLLNESPRRAVLQLLERVTVNPPPKPRSQQPLDERVTITPRFDPVADQYLTLKELDEERARDWYEDPDSDWRDWDMELD